MTAYANIHDVLPCPRTADGHHDWIDYREDSHQLYTGECGECAALLMQRWWGWEFRTGDEHFEDFQLNERELRTAQRPRARSFIHDGLERVPMRYNPVPVGPNTVYLPQDIGLEDPEPELVPDPIPCMYQPGDLEQFYQPRNQEQFP